MQELQLFETNKINNIQSWNLNFRSQEINENLFIWEISVPSGKFIVKYSLLENKKIASFEVLDYSWYLYINLGIIKNIKNLTQVILNRSIKKI